jgi:predicted aspartyl protease
MIGRVDQNGKALVEVEIASRLNGPSTSLTVWIDTAFDGHLVMSTELIKDLELDSLVETEAILADGSRVTLETYLCYVQDFLCSEQGF